MVEHQDGYKDRAEKYAAFADHSFSWKYIEKPAFDRNIPQEIYNHGALITDLGSGSGRVLRYHLLRGTQESNLTGSDASESMVIRARANYPGVHLIHTPMQELSLGSESQSLVTVCLALRYLNNEQLAATLRNMLGFLKPGGLFFALDVHPARYGMTDGFENYFSEGERKVATPWGDEDIYFYRTLGTYVQHIVNAGFVVKNLDECKIDPEGKKANPKEYDKYNISPARFAIFASRPSN